jgi:hypothetical protein
MKTITFWRVIYLSKLIEVVDLPHLSHDPLDWTCEQLNRFEDLMHFAYENYLSEISWNDERVKDRPCKPPTKLTTF